MINVWGMKGELIFDTGIKGLKHLFFLSYQIFLFNLTVHAALEPRTLTFSLGPCYRGVLGRKTPGQGGCLV